MRRLLALALLWPCLAEAAITHIQTKIAAPANCTSAGSITSIAETFASTPTIGNLVVVYTTYFRNNAANDISAVTDNQATGGNSYTVIEGPIDTSQDHVAMAWSVITKASGTFTVTVSFGANTETVANIAIAEFAGVNATPADGSNTGTGNSTAESSGAVTPTATGDLFVGAFVDGDANETYTAGNSFILDANNTLGNTQQGFAGVYLIATDSAAKTAAVTLGTSTVWAGMIRAFKASGGAAAVPARALMGVGQ